MGPSPSLAMATTAVATAAVLAFLRWALYPRHGKIIASPLRTKLPLLPADAVAQLGYTPDAFPGARDVATPYGSIRVYEFGPESGRKVLLVHGISTSCQTLGPIAHGLVAHAGCRVLLFDLFGRGFSDGVGDLPHDARLYASQMLLALASSPLAWTGRQAFDLVGYSMGGGVAVHFAATLPHLVRSLVLLAPAGLIRPARFGVVAQLVFRSGLVPERLLAAVTRRRLRQPLASSVKAREAAREAAQEATRENRHHAATRSDTDPVDLAVAEVSDAPGAAEEPQAPETAGVALSLRVMEYVRWMLAHHDGFVPAFMSCIRDAPLVGQDAAWAALARAVRGDLPSQSDAKAATGLSLCVVLGRNDDVVSAQDYAADALPLFSGCHNVTWTLVPGGHEFPMTYSRPVLRAIYGFWGGMDAALAALQVDEEEEKKAAVTAKAKDGTTADTTT